MARKPAAKFNLDFYKHPDRFGEWLGYRVDKVDRKKHAAETTLQIREDHLSPAGRVHGGVVSAFLDFSCGAAVFTTLEPQDVCSTVELKVQYFKPLNVGDRLRAKTEVVFRGRRLCAVHGFVYRGKEAKPVAMASATFHIVPGGAAKLLKKAPAARP